jgi:hypothetical protein
VAPPTAEQAQTFVDRGWATHVTSATFPNAAVAASEQLTLPGEGAAYFVPGRFFPYGPVSFLGGGGLDMSDPKIGARLRVEIRLLPSNQEGRSTPIANGYRPLCVFAGEDGSETVVGLCQLELAGKLMPGGVGEGTLGFAPEVSDLVRSLLRVGSEFGLAEGREVIGTARVLQGPG